MMGMVEVGGGEREREFVAMVFIIGGYWFERGSWEIKIYIKPIPKE